VKAAPTEIGVINPSIKEEHRHALAETQVVKDQKEVFPEAIHLPVKEALIEIEVKEPLIKNVPSIAKAVIKNSHADLVQTLNQEDPSRMVLNVRREVKTDRSVLTA
jgi:hypothetical protein